MLADAVYAYVGKPGDRHIESLERTIIAAESQLKKIVPVLAAGAKLPSPDVTAAMLENGPTQAEAMLLALNKWIGAGQQAGVLNGAPFNFDHGLKIAPPPPTSKPAGTVAEKAAK